MRYLVLLVLLFSAPALAQGGANGAGPVGFFGCDPWYPKTPLGDQMRVTRLAVHIAQNGWVSNPSLVQSSGDADYDAAAMQCAPHMALPPLKQNGVYIAVDWQVEVYWRTDGHSNFNIPVSGPACRMDSFIGKRPAPAIVSYHIGPDGSTHGLALVQSSGRSDPDDEAMNCIMGKHFPPVLIDGKPADVESVGKIDWH